MNIRTTFIASSLIAAALASASAHAELQGRDLNGIADGFEAYYDTVLDITWLADANSARTAGYDDDGKMTWADANTWAAQLDINGYTDWRLPTVGPINNNGTFNYNVSFNGSTDVGYNITSPHSEMAHLFYVTLGNPGDVTTTGAVSGCYVNSSYTCLDNVGPFTNLQASSYWSATEFALDTVNAWHFRLYDGYQGATSKITGFHALAVSPGDIAAVPEAQTYAMMLAGLGLVGWRARRRG